MEELSAPVLTATPHWRCGAPTCRIKHESEAIALRCSKRTTYAGRLRITTDPQEDDPAYRIDLRNRIALERLLLHLRDHGYFTYKSLTSITGLSPHMLTKLIRGARTRHGSVS